MHPPSRTCDRTSPARAPGPIDVPDVNLAATTCDDAAIAPFADAGPTEGLLGPTFHMESPTFSVESPTFTL